MKILLIALMAITLVGCAEDCDHQRVINDLSQENSNLRDAYYSARSACPAYYPFGTQKTCVEDKQLTGCISFRDRLETSDIKLSKKMWEFCDQFEAK